MCDKGKCYKTSNNKYFGCPPRMDDGRHFTDYRGNCYVNNLISNNKKINSSFQYRMFLTRNANKMIDLNRIYSCQKNCSTPCQKPYDNGTMLPEFTKVICDSEKCENTINNSNGIGIGRKYSSQSLSCHGINTKSLPKNYCTTPSDNFNYFPVNKKKVSRRTIPGGSLPLIGGDPTMYQ